MRLVSYNIEWFNALFDDAGHLINDGGWSGRWNVTRAAQIAALGQVFQAMDADALMIIEAPDSSRARDGVFALESFALAFGLRTNRALVGFTNDTQQEIALLFDPNVMHAEHHPGGGADQSPPFDGTFSFDLNTDAAPEKITWSKPPLEVAVTLKTGQKLDLIGVHAKSKAPHGARNEKQATRIAIENRRKQLAQCIWLRTRVDELLAQGSDLIVMGDFNDGPGLDEYESLFGRSGIEIVLGEGDATRLFDPHARMALGRRIGAMPSTARFQRKGQPFLQALLDYIMVSPSLQRTNPHWQIWHPFDHPDCYQDVALREALLAASDHFPVVLDLTLPDAK